MPPIDFKTANADIDTIIMGNDINTHLCVFNFKVSLHYRYTDASPVRTRKGKVIIYMDVLKSCPSIIDLSRAIEKKIRRIEILRR